VTRQSEHGVDGVDPRVALRRQWRRLAAVATALALGSGALALFGWHQLAELRDVDGLVRATATVTDVDLHRRRADVLDVEFGTARGVQRASVPYDGPARTGDAVAIGYVAADPIRVRTLDGWAPDHRRSTFFALGTGAVAIVTGGPGLVGRLRRGRREPGEATGGLVPGRTGP